MKIPACMLWLYERLGGKLGDREGYRCPFCKAGAHRLHVRWSAAGKKGDGPVRAKMRIECDKCKQSHLFIGNGERALRVWSELHGTRELQAAMERARTAELKRECSIGCRDTFPVGMAKLQMTFFQKEASE